MNKLKKEDGSVIIICALLIPVLIGFIGIAIDAGYVLYHKNCMIEATEIAGHSGLLMSYDVDIWENEGRVVLDEALLASNVKIMFDKNCGHGDVEVKLLQANAFELNTSITIDYIFMGVFGFETKTIDFNQIFEGG